MWDWIGRCWDCSWGVWKGFCGKLGRVRVVVGGIGRMVGRVERELGGRIYRFCLLMLWCSEGGGVLDVI